ncbi:MAG: PAS domain S-box protein [Flavobacteriaceae bacterium]|nr:PAS domain S-box protein [Flavobacteriaceae bacterium]
MLIDAVDIDEELHKISAMFPKVSFIKVAFFVAIITTLAGLLVLIGWQFDIIIFKTFGFGNVTMKPNAAVFFLLSGLTLILLQFSNPIAKWMSGIFSSLIIFGGLLTLLQFIFKVDFGIDELLFSVKDTSGYLPHPSRIAANAALNFILLGTVLFYLSRYRNRINYFIEFCLVTTFSISLVGFLSFIFGFSDSAGATGYSRMAVNAATSFIVLCLGIYFTIRNHYPNKITIEQKLFAGLNISAIIIIFISFLSFSNLQSMHDAADKVKHTYIVKNKIEDVLTSIIDIETSTRGFALSGNERFLEPIEKAKLEIKEQIVGLRNLTKDNPHQQNNINKLEQLIIKKIEFSDLKVQTRKLKGLTATIPLINAEKGQQLSDSIRVLKDKMIAEENQLLSLRDKTENKRMEQSQTVIIVGIIFQLSLLTLIFLFVSNDVSGKRKAEMSLRNLNEDLEEIVEERTTELRQNEARLLKAQQIAHLGFLDWDLKTNKIICSDEVYQLYGIKKESASVSFENISKGVHPDDKEFAKKNFDLAIKGEKKYNIDHRIIKPNGAIIWVNAQAELILDDNGNPKSLLGSILDITERKQTEEILQEKEERFRRTLDLGVVGMATTHPITYYFLSANKYLCDMIGYSEEELLQMTWAEITFPKEEKVNEVEKLLSGEHNGYVMEKQYQHKDGHMIDITLSVQGVRKNDGTIDYILILIDDITKRKKAENRKFQQTQILESIIYGLPLSTILEAIVKLVEAEDPTTLCSILLMDDEGKHLLNGAAPSLPEFYNQAIDGIEIGEKVGSCGAAAYIKTRIIAEDLLTHPNWAAYTELTQRANLRSCWSEPILDAENNVLGTFAIYHRQAQAPQSEEIELLKSVVSLASLAISSNRNEEKIRNINLELEQRVEERTQQLAETNENLLKEIDERKQAEEALQESSAFNQSIIDSSTDCIKTLDLEGKLQSLNLTGQHLLEIENLDKYLNLPYKNFWKGADFVAASDAISNALQGQFGSFKGFSPTMGGTPKWWDVSISPILGSNGKPQQLLVVSRDITESKKAEDRFKLVVESAPNAIILVGSNGKIQLINKQTENYFGYNRDELIGKKIEMLVPNPVGMGHERLRSVFISKPTARNMGTGRDLFGLRKDGTKIPIEVGLNPIHINNETMILTSIIDITERKKAEEEIKNAKTEAERANVAKSEFLSRMSHELRTPLNSILGFTQLMDMGELNPAHKKGVDHIMKSGKHLLNLINEVLDLSRIEAGELSISIEPVEIKRIITETIDIIYPMATERAIKIELENTDMLNLYVKADHQKLKQVMLNLVNNAVKYNDESGLVTIRIKHQNEKIRIYITDTGKGIASEEINKLFNPFQRIGTEISIIEGTGLGLAVSKKLIEAMNGSIGVESEIDKGSTFWIELPQTESQNGHHERMGDFKANETVNKNISGTLLYIEDNISNQQLVKQIMDTQRTSVNLITNMYGKNALNLAIDYKPDLILLDLDLPDIHGSKVLKLLLNNSKTKEIPVIVLSADATEKQIENLLKAGAKAYLTKPIDVLELLKEVDKTMNN